MKFLLFILLLPLIGSAQMVKNASANYAPAPQGASYDAATTAFMTAAGIPNDATSYLSSPHTVTGAQYWDGINSFIVSAKANGYWTKLVAFYPMIGASAATQKYNLIDPRDLDAAYRLTFTGTWTYDWGAKPDGTTAFANTHLIPTTALTANSCHLAYTVDNSVTTGTPVEMGVFSAGGSNKNALFVRFNDGNCYGEINAVATTAANSTPTGNYMVSRISSISLSTYKNGSTFGSNTTSDAAAFANKVVYLGALNNDGTTNYFSSRRCEFASIGAGMTGTDAANYNTDLNTLKTAIFK